MARQAAPLTDVTLNCPKCGEPFLAAYWQVARAERKRTVWCKSCTSRWNKETRQRRKAEGNPIQHRRDPEKDRLQKAIYNQRPEVKARHIVNFNKRLEDPVEQKKHRTRWKTREAVRCGKIIKLPCTVCGKPEVEAHHHDYNKPFDVAWLCRKHHRAVHAQKSRIGTKP